ncbi:ABC transporter substrate-binding protein [Streptodolium elevatio]
MIQALRPGDPADVGGYRVVARLGAGGMGEVFLGRSASGRLVAIKVVRAELSVDPDFRARFRREVYASRRVSAFHTAAVVAADAAATPAWMVTEYIPGPSLEEAVRGHGAFPVHALRVLGAGLAEALEAIHACDLIHRDLKPSNILIAEDGPRVIDFGIARALEGATVTQTGYMVGSVGFLSPEQLQSERITPAADVFALGAVLCSAAGLAPFGGGSAQAMLYRVVHTEPDLTGLPPELRGIVADCLAKDPARRPQPTELVRMLTSDTTEDWLPDGVLASISERREHAQQLSRQAAAGAGSAPPAFSVSPGRPAHPGPAKQPPAPEHGTSHDPGHDPNDDPTTGSNSAVDPAPGHGSDSGARSGVGSGVGSGLGSGAGSGPNSGSASGFGTTYGSVPASTAYDGSVPPPPPGTPSTPPGAYPQPSHLNAPPPPTGPPQSPHSPPYGSTPHSSTPHSSSPHSSPSHSSTPHGTPPPHSGWQSPYGPPSLPFPHQPAAPPRTSRLDRMPGGRRTWLAVVVVTTMAVLAGIGIGTAQLIGGGSPSAKSSDRPTDLNSPAQNPQGGGPRGGTATVSINADSKTLDPVGTTYEAYADGQRMSALYDPLVVFRQSTGKVEPHLAKSLTSTPDGFTWSLELRPDVKFTDGTPLDAEAVKFNWDRHAQTPDSMHSNAIRGAAMRVVSTTRLDITLPVPDLTYDHLVADELAYVGSPTAIRADPAGFGKKPVGAGPFMLQSWTPGDKQVFVRNPDYWQGPDRPLLDSLVFQVDTQQPMAPVIDGRADVNFQSANHDLQQARSADLELVPSVNAGGVMMGFNSGVAPFDDPKARQAVSLALDPDAIAKEAGTGAKAADSIVPSDSPLSAVAPEHRPDAAKAQALFDELAAAGKPVSFKVTAGQGEQATLDAVKKQLAGFRNVTMTYELADAARFGEILRGRQFQAVWGYESGSDLDTWLFAITRGGYSGNYLAYRNDTVDTAWTTIRGARTPEAKAAAYRTLLTELAEDPPWWLYAEISVYAVQREGSLTGLDGAYADGVLRWDRVGKK